VASKVHAELRVLVYPQDAIPKVTRRTCSIADVIGGLLYRDQGEATDDVQTDTTTASQEWGRQPAFPYIGSDLEFMELRGNVKEGPSDKATTSEDDKGISGFALKPRTQFWNCKAPLFEIRNTAGDVIRTDPRGETTFSGLDWMPIKPEVDPKYPSYLKNEFFPGTTRQKRSQWKTILPDKKPARTCIMHTTQRPDETISIRTTQRLDANQHFRIDLGFHGTCRKQKKPSWFRFSWANDTYSLMLRSDGSPCIERKDEVVHTKTSGNPTEKPKWKVWRKLTDLGKTNFKDGTVWLVMIRRIAGRMVISVNGKSFDLLDSHKVNNGASEEKATYEVREAKWNAGKLKVEMCGAMVSVGIGLIRYDGGSKGYFERKLSWPTTLSGLSSNTVGYTGGYTPAGTSTQVQVTLPTTMDRSVQYRCTLKGGIDTPLVSKVVARYVGTVVTDSHQPLDISSALLNAKESLAEPGVMNGAEWTMDISRNILQTHIENWQEYVKPYNPISVAVRWHYSDGTSGPWTGRLMGYIWQMSKTISGYHQWKMSLTLRDMVCRLQKPAALIDGYYYPLDAILVENPDQPLYGGTCVQEILRIALGDDWADAMNLTGDPLEYFGRMPSGNTMHYPLYSRQADVAGYFEATQPPVQNGFLFPPPWGSDALSWIQNFCGYDFAVFYFGYTGGQGITIEGVQWPVPVYGQYWNILSGTNAISIPDAIYVDGDASKVLSHAETQTLPEWDVNRVLVWGKTPAGDPGQLPFPAVWSGEARLPMSDSKAPENSWERTHLMQGTHFYHPGSAQATAEFTMREFIGKEIRRVQLRFPGRETMWWGDKVMPLMSKVTSDPTLGIHNEEFRVIRLENNYDIQSGGIKSFQTTATCFPLSATGN